MLNRKDSTIRKKYTKSNILFLFNLTRYEKQQNELYLQAAKAIKEGPNNNEEKIKIIQAYREMEL